ncbi:MAG: hypothetical protein K0R92_50 [Lachnospiraceae bacterium]|nr:hypothetical protein [Lachnospiraceae bacterium]
MKKDMLTILILALSILNLVLGAVIVFTVVPTTIRTNKLISKVATAIDLELQDTEGTEEPVVDIADLEVYQIPEDLTITLKKGESDASNHYAVVSVSLSINTKSDDYKDLQPSVELNVNVIKEIINDEFSKYTVNDVTENKEVIKKEILKRIQEYFNSDFITSISVGKLLVQ